MASASHATLQLPPLAKQSMAQLLAEAKRAGVAPEDYAKRLVEDALFLQREAEEKSFSDIMKPVRKAAGTVDDVEIVKLVEKGADKPSAWQRPWEKEVILPDSSLRLVLDTNVLLAGLVSESSASQKIVDALEARKAVPLVSPPVMAEYGAVLLHPTIVARFAHLSRRRVELALHRLRYIGDEYRTDRVKFEFPRDPRDAKFIELAIVGTATHIVTLDLDLLSLPTARTDAGKRFRQRLPGIAILSPGVFIEQFETSLRLD